jgi:hypothetical protein
LLGMGPLEGIGKRTSSGPHRTWSHVDAGGFGKEGLPDAEGSRR